MIYYLMFLKSHTMNSIPMPAVTNKLPSNSISACTLTNKSPNNIKHKTFHTLVALILSPV